MASFNNPQTVSYAALPSSENILSDQITAENARVEMVRQFFHRYGSPLEPYAQNIIDEADTYNIDWRLLPAIAMQESNLCLKAPQGSNNCWGFGIYGKTVTTFPDYPTAIHTVSKTLAEKYVNKGLTSPQQIMTMYTPANNGSWARSVDHFMNSLQ